jgi:hypothetical protein
VLSVVVPRVGCVIG